MSRRGADPVSAPRDDTSDAVGAARVAGRGSSGLGGSSGSGDGVTTPATTTGASGVGSSGGDGGGSRSNSVSIGHLGAAGSGGGGGSGGGVGGRSGIGATAGAAAAASASVTSTPSQGAAGAVASPALSSPSTSALPSTRPSAVPTPVLDMGMPHDISDYRVGGTSRDIADAAAAAVAATRQPPSWTDAHVMPAPLRSTAVPALHSTAVQRGEAAAAVIGSTSRNVPPVRGGSSSEAGVSTAEGGWTRDASDRSDAAASRHTQATVIPTEQMRADEELAHKLYEEELSAIRASGLGGIGAAGGMDSSECLVALCQRWHDHRTIAPPSPAPRCRTQGQV